jgi:hypothetical protein
MSLRLSRCRCRLAPLRAAILCALLAAAPELAALAAGPADLASYVGRPIYSEPVGGLQLPPGCEVDPSWRSPVVANDLEVWVAQCGATARVWLLKRQVLEIVDARQSRLRFQVLDERILPEESAGDSLSVQCVGPHDEPGYVVRGARWRTDDKELRLRSAKGVLRVDSRGPALADADVGAVECIRFPDREAMMKRLQQRN